MNYARLRELFERDGEKKFTMYMVNDMIREGKLNARNFSLRGLWEAMGRPDLNEGRRLLDRKLTDVEFTEAVESSAFPKITGALINKVVQDAYEAEFGTGMELVTVIPSSQRDDVVVGFTALETLSEVEEGMPYEQKGFGEKYHRIRNRKWGEIIPITEEMVKFDQTNMVLQKANAVGIAAKGKQDEIIMKVILGSTNTGVYASWRPAAVATTLYSDTSTDPYTTATFDNVNTNALADNTDIDENMALLGAATDETARPIRVNPTHILTGWAKIHVARRIVESPTAAIASQPAGVRNTWGQLRPMVSPWVATELGANYWLLGEFKKQFFYTEVFPLQTFQAKPGNDQEFERDTIYQVKARFMGGCGAVSNRYIVRSTGAS